MVFIDINDLQRFYCWQKWAIIDGTVPKLSHANYPATVFLVTLKHYANPRLPQSNLVQCQMEADIATGSVASLA